MKIEQYPLLNMFYLVLNAGDLRAGLRPDDVIYWIMISVLAIRTKTHRQKTKCWTLQSITVNENVQQWDTS